MSKKKIKQLINLFIGFLRYRILKFRCPAFVVGSNFYCGKNCFVSSKNYMMVGNNFYMGSNCHISANALIGNDVMLASSVAFVGGDHKIDSINTAMRFSGRDTLKTIVIKDNVWIGHGVIIMHGVVIETGSVIAAGSVVTKNVSSNSIVAGNPAKFIRYRIL